MCTDPNCAVMVTRRRSYSALIEEVRCSELDPEDRARFGCEVVRRYQSSTTERECASAQSSSKTLISKAVSLPLSPSKSLTIAFAVSRRS